MTGPPAVLALNPRTIALAERIAELIEGEVHAFERRCRGLGHVGFDEVAPHLRALFGAGRTVVAIMASGIVVRALAPVLDDKHDEPPVLALAEDGATIVPLLGGHRGANAMARKLAEATGAHAAITTAGDVSLGVALDDPPEGYALVAGEAPAAMAAVLNGAGLEVDPTLGWVEPRSGTGTGQIVRLTASDEKAATARTDELVYAVRRHVVGVGCERGTEPFEMAELVREALAAAGIAPESVAAIASIDLKADEGAIHHVAEALHVPARFLDAGTLEAEAGRLENPSEVVFAEVGCHGVAEGAALAGAGPDAALIVPKRKSRRATCAIARSDSIVRPEGIGRDRGALSVVGIGPGAAAWRSPEVTRAVRTATDLVGYSLYLDLLGPLTEGRTRHDFPLGAEEDRVRAAMELAGQGRHVALVCSGDAGIYAMATLVFELLENGDLSDGARRVAVTVCPGISALQAAAARAGAPLGHDFCAISLSDLLTPWDAIRTRIDAAAHADFVIAFYNPVSRRRTTQLAYARERLLAARPPDTPVVLASNLGRDAEHVRIVPLAELRIEDVDMLTTVIVGSSESRVVKTGDGRRWTYTPRGYSGKATSRIALREAAT